jgi:purine-binding chemotaxis protein CheW
MQFYEHFSEQELEILRARAERLATPVQTESQEEASTALFVKVHAESYALPMEAVNAVYEGVQITPVPNVPGFALGIANIRGRIVFVLGLGVLLGIPGSTLTEGSMPVIVLESDLGIAFQVDAIEGIENLPTGHLTKDIPNLTLIKKAYLQGVSPDGKALLDVKSILNDLIAMANSAIN